MSKPSRGVGKGITPGNEAVSETLATATASAAPTAATPNSRNAGAKKRKQNGAVQSAPWSEYKVFLRVGPQKEEYTLRAISSEGTFELHREGTTLEKDLKFRWHKLSNKLNITVFDSQLHEDQITIYFDAGENQDLVKYLNTLPSKFEAEDEEEDRMNKAQENSNQPGARGNKKGPTSASGIQIQGAAVIASQTEGSENTSANVKPSRASMNIPTAGTNACKLPDKVQEGLDTFSGPKHEKESLTQYLHHRQSPDKETVSVFKHNQAHIFGEVGMELQNLRRINMLSVKTRADKGSVLLAQGMPVHRELYTVYLCRDRAKTGKQMTAVLSDGMKKLALKSQPEAYREAISEDLAAIIDAMFANLKAMRQNCKWLWTIGVDIAFPLSSGGKDARRLYSSSDNCGLLEGENSILKWLEAETTEDIGCITEHASKMTPGVLNWMCTITDGNASNLPLLKVGDQGYVDEHGSKFHSMRNAQTRLEWLSLFHYLVIVMIRDIHHHTLPPASESTSLANRCKVAADRMLGTGVTVKELYADTFLGSSGPMTMVIGSEAIWKAFDAKKTKSDQRSQVRMFSLIEKRYNILLATFWKVTEFDGKALNEVSLSVKGLFREQQLLSVSSSALNKKCKMEPRGSDFCDL